MSQRPMRRLAAGLLAAAVLAAAHAEEGSATAPARHGSVPQPVSVSPAAAASAALHATPSPGKHAAEAAAAKPESEAMAPKDEELRKLLAQRVGGSGELILKASAVAPAEPKAAPRRAAPRRKAEPSEADREAARRAAAYRAEQALHDWAYQGERGPEHWAEMSPAFAQCASGKRQSPIDIRDGIRVQLDPIRFDYQSSGFAVVDNGHTIQVNVAPGSSIEVLGHRYDLVYFDFHKPGEERVNGRQYDMVVHLVHKDLDGNLAVIAVPLARGAAQATIQTVWNYLPLEQNQEVSAPVPLDPNKLLPQDRRYYTYMGSLTTPPCTEGVLWMVMKQPLTVSQDQIAVFSRLYPMNARPIQPAAGRLIKESN